jgi:hypothetical protein
MSRSARYGPWLLVAVLLVLTMCNILATPVGLKGRRSDG